MKAPSLWFNPLQAGLQRVTEGLLVFVAPALLAGVTLRYLLPASAGLASGPLGLGLFFLYVAMARVWRFRIPGGRYASALPAHIAPGESGERLEAWAREVAFYERARPVGEAATAAVPLETLRSAIGDGDLAAARDARRRLESEAADSLTRLRRREALRTLAALAVVACAGLLIRAAVVQPYRVTTGSMLPTLEPGDLVAGDRLSLARGRPPARGDVIVFQSAAVISGAGAAGAPELLTKRVIGLPGDRIGMMGGTPTINGWAVPSCDAGDYVYLLPDGSGQALHGRLLVEFLDGRSYLTVRAAGRPFAGTYVVQPGEVFVLGDDRGNSQDSRAYGGGRGGGVPLDAIEAIVGRFLIGSHRNGEADLTRALQPLDALGRRARIEGVAMDAIEQGVARCIEAAPPSAPPPPEGDPLARGK